MHWPFDFPRNSLKAARSHRQTVIREVSSLTPLQNTTTIGTASFTPKEAQCDSKHRAWLVDLDGTLYYHRWVRAAMAAELVLGHWRAIPLIRAFRYAQEAMRQEAIQHKNCP